MRIISNEKWIEIEIDQNAEAYCVKHAGIMCNTLKKKFPNDPTIEDATTYALWNVGKISTWYLMRTMSDKIRIERIPFKDEYIIHHDIDDFVITVLKDGKHQHIETRTSKITDDITPERALSISAIKPNVIYVFVVYNPAKFTATIVGWANWEVLKQKAFEVPYQHDNKKEDIREAGKFQIKIGDLCSPMVIKEI